MRIFANEKNLRVFLAPSPSFTAKSLFSRIFHSRKLQSFNLRQTTAQAFPRCGFQFSRSPLSKHSHSRLFNASWTTCETVCTLFELQQRSCKSPLLIPPSVRSRGQVGDQEEREVEEKRGRLPVIDKGSCRLCQGSMTLTTRVGGPYLRVGLLAISRCLSTSFRCL